MENSVMTQSNYEKKGYASRKEYLRSLAIDNGVPYRTVHMLADALGPNEDFDGLVTEVEDYAEMFGEE